MPGLAPQVETARGGRPGFLRLAASRGLAQRVVLSAVRLPMFLSKIEAGPRARSRYRHRARRFSRHSVHDVDRGGVDRQIYAKALAAAGGEQRHQQFAIIVPRDALLEEAHAVLFSQGSPSSCGSMITKRDLS